MGLALVCFIACGFIMWGMLAKFGERLHDYIVEPLCIRYAANGTKGIPMFLLVGILFNSAYKALSRSPLWITLYYALTYAGYAGIASLKFTLFCIGIAGLARTAKDVRRHFEPPYDYKDNYNHSYRDSW
jgi:hypothetical protein